MDDHDTRKEHSHILWFEHRGRYISVEYEEYLVDIDGEMYRKRVFRELSGDKTDAHIVRHLNRLENDMSIVSRMKRLHREVPLCEACFGYTEALSVPSKKVCNRCHRKLPFLGMFRKSCIACSAPLCKECYIYSTDNLFIYKNLQNIHTVTCV